ncbi:MAG: DUF3604 domain-containing protein [Chloroflexota bacterium]
MNHYPMPPDPDLQKLISHRLGTINLSPIDDIIAGSIGTWLLTYTVGSYGIDSGGQIKIAFPLVTDWETPQFDQPTESGYTTIATDGRAKLRVTWQPKGYVRPWSPCIVIDVYDGSLDPGDTITITLGNTAHGSPGMRAQTYLESKFEFRTLVDPTNGCDPRRIPTSPQIAIVAAEMTSLVCMIPSQGMVNEPIEFFVKGEDQWRNPTLAPENISFVWGGQGTAAIENRVLTVSEAGPGYLQASIGDFSCRSNPIEIVSQAPTLQRYWGDLHAQTKETVGTGSEDEYFTFGRDWAFLDFMSHQGNDFQMRDEYWQHINDTTKTYHRDGDFVVFPGYEWSANSPAGGDHNVIYRQEGMPILRSSHWLVPNVPETEQSPAHPADVFFAKLKQSVPLEDVLVCAHVGGRYANIRKYFDQELVSLVELVSCWGVFEWMLWDAFDKGYIVGVMCNSDGHHGRPGAEGAGMTEFGIENGLTCVLAESLTRNAVFDALKSRRCYGTTGARMLLDFTADVHPMGSVLAHRTAPLSMQASVTGTAPLESLQLYQGKTILQEVRPPAFSNLLDSNHVRIRWQGSRERGRQRRVTWDGQIRVEGCQIESAALFSFDVVADGITSQNAQTVHFRSRTTGDCDGLDLVLNDAKTGTIHFESEAGTASVNLADLISQSPRKTFDFGGVDMQVMVERYPAAVKTQTLNLSHAVTPPTGKLTPYFVKATQVDGEMGWSSPIYCST